MKILPVLSIVLVIAGLALILYEDPAVLGASAVPSTQGNNFFNASVSGGPGALNASSLPPGCQREGSAIKCTGTPTQGDAGLLTIAGIGLCGAGLFASGVEAVSKSGLGPQAVT